MKIKPFIEIVWRDAEDGPTWASEKEAIAFANQECLVKSRGWLIKRTKKFVVIASDESISGNNPGELGSIRKIPKNMIVEYREIIEKLPEIKEAPEEKS